MTGYLFPVSHEAALFRSHLSEGEFYRLGSIPCTSGTLGGKAVTVAELGMGAENSLRSLQSLLDHFNFTTVVLAGYAGALTPDLTHGDVVLLENFSTPSLLDKTGDTFRRVLGTTASALVTSIEDKRRLFEQSKAAVVDMESRPVHDLLSSKNIPVLTCRAISDTAEQSLPAQAMSASFDTALNRPSPGRLLRHLIAHPGDLCPFFQFVEKLGAVRRSLTAKLLDLHRIL